MQASSHNLLGVVDDKVNEAGVTIATPDRNVVGYFVVEWTWARVAVCNVVAPAPQPAPASHLKSVMRDVNFLRSGSRYRFSCCG